MKPIFIILLLVAAVILLYGLALLTGLITLYLKNKFFNYENYPYPYTYDNIIEESGTGLLVLFIISVVVAAIYLIATNQLL